jgi:hypothetical protein
MKPATWAALAATCAAGLSSSVAAVAGVAVWRARYGFPAGASVVLRMTGGAEHARALAEDAAMAAAAATLASVVAGTVALAGTRAFRWLAPVVAFAGFALAAKLVIAGGLAAWAAWATWQGGSRTAMSAGFELAAVTITLAAIVLALASAVVAVAWLCVLTRRLHFPTFFRYTGRFICNMRKPRQNQP